MKKTLSRLLLAILVLASMTMAVAKHEENLDSIVAIINEDVVTGSELSHAVNLLKIQRAQDITEASLPEATMRKQALQQLIDKKLQLQLAQQAGIKISDKELDQAIGNVAKQNSMTVSMLYERLNQDGIKTADYRKEIREQMALRRLQQQELAGRITISPQEVTSFMRSATWKRSIPREYHVLDILVPLSDTPDTQEITQAKARANQVIRQLKQGKAVSDIMAGDTKAAEPLQSEDLGFRPLADLPSIFIDHLQNMNKDDISEPIQAGNGFHILKMMGIKMDSSTHTASKQQIKELLMQRKYEDAMQSWLSKMKGQAYIVINS